MTGVKTAASMNGAPVAGAVAPAVASGSAVSGPAASGPVGVPPSPARPRNTLWIIFGLLLMFVGGLAALMIAGGLAARVEVLVASGPIEEGQVLTEGDLAVAELSIATGVQAISPSQRDDFVGLVASGPIGPGAVLHPSMFVDSLNDEADQVIVGAALQPGEYPRIGLRPGDRVRLIDVAAIGQGTLVEAEVVEALPTGSANELLVSLRVNESQASGVSEIAAREALRLALIDEGFDDLVQPLAPAEPVAPLEPEAVDGEQPQSGSEVGSDSGAGAGSGEGAGS